MDQVPSAVKDSPTFPEPDRVLSSAVASPIDRLELVAETSTRPHVEIRTVADLAELAALLRLRSELTLTGPLLDRGRRAGYDRLRALGGSGRGRQRLEWLCGELQEFDGDWAGRSLKDFETRFRVRLTQAGVPAAHAVFICAALDEIISNAQEHACTDLPSLATFEVTRAWWIFSVTDFGIGIPERLRQNPAHAQLADPDAISRALEHGVSTFPESGRGIGFSQVFRALTDRSAKVRLRSGRGLVTWEGLVGGTGRQQLSPRPTREGAHVRAGAKIGR